MPWLWSALRGELEDAKFPDDLAVVPSALFTVARREMALYVEVDWRRR